MELFSKLTVYNLFFVKVFCATFLVVLKFVAQTFFLKEKILFNYLTFLSP